MNPQKLFNYQIQAFETESNVEMIKLLFKELNGYDSKLILYTYDSFLIDFNPTDGKKLLALPSPDVPVKKGAVNDTALAPDPDDMSEDCSVLDNIVAE